MFQYFPGVVLVQLIAITLLWVFREAPLQQMLVLVGLPCLVVSAVVSLWLSMIGRMDSERRKQALRDEHAKECLGLHREIERAKADVLQKASADKAKLVEKNHRERERLVTQTHKQLIKQERSANRRANVKVGFGLVMMTSLGVLLLISELLTLGFVTIMTALGAMGGYTYRWKQTRYTMDRLENAPVVIDNPALQETNNTTSDIPRVRTNEVPDRLLPITLDANAPPRKKSMGSDS